MEEWDPDKAYNEGLLYLPKNRFIQIRAKDGKVIDDKLRTLKKLLTFVYGSSDYNTEEKFVLYRETKHHIGVPRHYFLRATLDNLNLDVVDLCPSKYEEVDVYSQIELDRLRSDQVQHEAVATLAASGDGILCLACGMGKTPTTLHLWAQKRVPLVVINDNSAILEQWAESIRRFITPGDLPIGKVYGNQTAKAKWKEWEKPAVLATIQSVLSEMGAGFPDEIRRRFGMVVYDEVHHLAAPVFSRTAPLFMGYRLGLSATPTRTDRLQIVFEYHLGKVLYQHLLPSLTPRFEFYTPQTTRDLMENDPTFRRQCVLYDDFNLQKLLTALTNRDDRTKEIAAFIQRKCVGRRPLIISQRRDMLFQLKALLPDAGVLVAETHAAERTRIMREAPMILSIQKIGKEGLHASNLDTLVLCEAIKDPNMFQQLVGRVLDDFPGRPDPLVLVIADHLGKPAGRYYGMLSGLKRLITTWDPSKGGPYSWEDVSS